MAFALPLAMVATAVGGGIAAYGQYQAGQAQAAAARYRGQTLGTEASTLDTWAQIQRAEAAQRVQGVGLQYRAEAGRESAMAGARNITGGSAAAVQASIGALGRQAGATTAFEGEKAAFQTGYEAQEKRAGAGLEYAAATQDITAGEIGAAGTAIGTVGKVASMAAEGSSVSSKWYG